jgi:hypothetical protein
MRVSPGESHGRERPRRSIKHYPRSADIQFEQPKIDAFPSALRSSDPLQIYSEKPLTDRAIHSESERNEDCAYLLVSQTKLHLIRGIDLQIQYTYELRLASRDQRLAHLREWWVPTTKAKAVAKRTSTTCISRVFERPVFELGRFGFVCHLALQRMNQTRLIWTDC